MNASREGRVVRSWVSLIILKHRELLSAPIINISTPFKNRRRLTTWQSAELALSLNLNFRLNPSFIKKNITLTQLILTGMHTPQPSFKEFLSFSIIGSLYDDNCASQICLLSPATNPKYLQLQYAWGTHWCIKKYTSASSCPVLYRTEI